MCLFMGKGALPKGRDLGTVTRPWLWDVLKSIGYVTMKLEVFFYLFVFE